MFSKQEGLKMVIFIIFSWQKLRANNFEIADTSIGEVPNYFWSLVLKFDRKKRVSKEYCVIAAHNMLQDILRTKIQVILMQSLDQNLASNTGLATVRQYEINSVPEIFAFQNCFYLFQYACFKL